MVDVVTISDNNVTLEQTAAPVELVVINSVSGDTSGVTSVNGDSGPSVTLDADDISDTTTTNKFATAAELAQIATNQTNISTNSTNITLKQDDLDLVSQVDAEAGTSTVEKVWTAQRVAQAIAALVTHPVVFLDTEFAIQDNTSGFQTSYNLDGLTANRVMTMPDFDVDFSNYFDGSGNLYSITSINKGIIYFGSDSLSYIFRNGNNLQFQLAGGTRLIIDTSNIRVPSLTQFSFSSSSTNPYVVADAGIKRISAGLLGITDGSTGVGQLIHAKPTRTETAAYTIDATTDHTIRQTTAGTTITADAAVGIEGQPFRVKNASTGDIYLDSTLSQTFDGDLTWTIASGDWIDFEADDTGNYMVTG